MAFFRSRRARSSLLYAPAALASVLATSATRLESSSSADASKPTGPGVEFVGVFVDAASAKALRASYPSKFAAANNANSEDTNPLFVVLKYNPTDKEKEAFAPLAGRTAQLHVQGYVEDSETQAVVVRVTTESGDAIEFESVHGANIPHVTLASVNGGQGLNSGYSSVLLERLQADNRLQWVLDANANNDETNNEWAGELPAFESKLLPLFNPFPASPARVTKATSDDVIKGTVCVSSSYDPETGKCVGAPAKAECGFCKFMKAGPCGTEFSAWEACLDRCKQNGLDFIEHCGNETLALRDCVDANPEYYSVLNEPPEDEKESAEAEAEVEAGQS